MKKILTKDRLSGMMTPLLIILAALLVVTLLLLIVGLSPGKTFSSLIMGAFGSSLGLINTLTKSVPICLAALGVAIARKAGIFNIGVNGQVVFGSIGTVIVGVYCTGLPAYIHIPLALLAGALFGVIFAALPTAIYVKKNTDLIVIFLLMNTIATKLVTWILFTYLKDPESMATASYKIQNSAKLPNLISVPAKLNIGVLIALAIVVIMYIYFYKTTAGYELRACGMNRQAATYAGINAKKYLASALLIGGALGGLAGGIEVLGTYYRLYDGFSPAYGFDGIPIALLSGGNPIGIVIGSIIFGALRVGSANMQIQAGTPSELVDVIQGVLICFIALEYIFHFFSGKLLNLRLFGRSKKEVQK